MTHLLTWRRPALWTTLQPATRQGLRFGFTFGKLSYCLSLHTVSGLDPRMNPLNSFSLVGVIHSLSMKWKTNTKRLFCHHKKPASRFGSFQVQIYRLVILTLSYWKWLNTNDYWLQSTWTLVLFYLNMLVLLWINPIVFQCWLWAPHNNNSMPCLSDPSCPFLDLVESLTQPVCLAGCCMYTVWGWDRDRQRKQTEKEADRCSWFSTSVNTYTHWPQTSVAGGNFCVFILFWCISQWNIQIDTAYHCTFTNVSKQKICGLDTKQPSHIMCCWKKSTHSYRQHLVITMKLFPLR